MLQRIDHYRMVNNMDLKLPEPFTANDKILLWFERHQDKTREVIAYHKFGALYAAHKFVDEVIGNWETKWLSDNMLLVNNWFVIRSDEKSQKSLEDIIEHEYSEREKKWALPIPYDGFARTIRAYHIGSHPDINTRTREARGLSKLSDEEVEKWSDGVITRERPPTERKAVEKKATPKERKPRVSRDGLVTIQQICADLKIDAKEARGALRAEKIEKPAAGWAWPTAEGERIKALVKKTVEKRRKK